MPRNAFEKDFLSLPASSISKARPALNASALSTFSKSQGSKGKESKRKSRSLRPIEV